MLGSIIGVLKVDTRSLDGRSYAMCGPEYTANFWSQIPHYV